MILDITSQKTNSLSVDLSIAVVCNEYVKVTFWGTRGTFPIIGKDERSFRSYDTSCVEIFSPQINKSILLDAGSGLEKCIRHSLKRKVKSFDIFMSHFHWDHLLGLFSFYDLINSGIKVRVFSPDKNIKKIGDFIFSFPLSPFSRKTIDKTFKFHFLEKKTIILNGFRATFHNVPHSMKTYAIEVLHKQKKIIYMPDVDLSLLSGKKRFLNSDLLICDSFHLQKDKDITGGWGHSSSQESALFAQLVKAKKLALFHYNNHYSTKKISAVYNEAKKNGKKIKIFKAYDQLTVDI